MSSEGIEYGIAGIIMTNKNKSFQDKYSSDNAKQTEDFHIKKRLTLESTMLKLAAINAIEAKKIRNRESYEQLVKELEFTVMSITMCFLSIEGFANSIGYEYYGNHPDPKRQNKWWNRISGSKPLSEHNLKYKLNHLLGEVALNNPSVAVIKSLDTKLQKKIDNIIDIRNNLIHYKAKTYLKSDWMTIKNGTTASPEFNIYNYEQTLYFFQIYKEIVAEFNTYSRKPYAGYVERILKEYGF